MSMNEQINMFPGKEKLEELQHKKLELESRVKAIEKDIKSGLDPDSSEQAVQLENYEVLLGILKNTEEELNTVNKKILELENAGT